jgi:hypothetical protein
MKLNGGRMGGRTSSRMSAGRYRHGDGRRPNSRSVARGRGGGRVGHAGVEICLGWGASWRGPRCLGVVLSPSYAPRSRPRLVGDETRRRAETQEPHETRSSHVTATHRPVHEGSPCRLQGCAGTAQNGPVPLTAGSLD